MLDENTPSIEACCVCLKTEITDDVLVCGCCKATRYCSKECQKSHRPYHKAYCSHIADLEKLVKDKVYGEKTVHQKQEDQKLRRKIMKLIGEKPMLKCFLGGKRVMMLWDTGSMVSMVDRRWCKRHFPNATIYPVSSFLDRELHVQAANETSIKFDGVILLDFSLKEVGGEGGENGEGEGETFAVPFLVSSEKIADPILGYNVIEYLVLEGSEEQKKELKLSLGHQEKGVDLEPLVSLIQKKAEDQDFLAEVKLPKDINVPAGHRMQVKCRAKVQTDEKEQVVYFAPTVADRDDEVVFSETVSTVKRGRTNHVVVEVMNLSRVDRKLQKGALLGSLHSVGSVVPMMSMVERRKEKRKKVVPEDGVTVNVNSAQDGFILKG